jgi:hypothetical protein
VNGFWAGVDALPETHRNLIKPSLSKWNFSKIKSVADAIRLKIGTEIVDTFVLKWNPSCRTGNGFFGF